MHAGKARGEVVSLIIVHTFLLHSEKGQIGQDIFGEDHISPRPCRKIRRSLFKERLPSFMTCDAIRDDCGNNAIIDGKDCARSDFFGKINGERTYRTEKNCRYQRNDRHIGSMCKGKRNYSSS